MVYYGVRRLIKGQQYFNRAPNYLLLVISYLLYAKANPTWCLYLLLITASTYFFARLIEAKQAYGKRIYIIVVGATISLFPLGIFKYYNFLTENITYFLNSLGFQVGIPGLNWAVPLGISFFSFQAVGYLFDVYYQRIKRNTIVGITCFSLVSSLRLPLALSVKQRICSLKLRHQDLLIIQNVFRAFVGFYGDSL